MIDTKLTTHNTKKKYEYLFSRKEPIFRDYLSIYLSIYLNIDYNDAQRICNNYKEKLNYKVLMDLYLAQISGRNPYSVIGNYIENLTGTEKENKKRIMEICLAGGMMENLQDFSKNFTNSTDLNIDKSMNIFLTGNDTEKKLCQDNLLKLKDINVLESFFYIRDRPDFAFLIPYFNSFLLDSGAFTYLNGNKERVDWNKYIEMYAAFINKYNIELFLELDIDSIIGLENVEILRAKLEKLTNKKCIPVWHKNRGKEYFIKMCKEYSYVAIGGIVTKEIPTNQYEKAFPWFIKTAHQYGAKIHGLGYTRVANLHKYHFDSVDSTAWIHGNRGGFLFKFNPNTGLMNKISSKSNQRLKSREGAVHNFNEWVKFSIYASKNL